MANDLQRIPAEDLDEASIFLYRIWSYALLGQHPEALVLREPEYVVIGPDWALYANRGAADEKQVDLVAGDVRKPVVCAAPGLQSTLAGLDTLTGEFRGSARQKSVVAALARAAKELPPASKDRDPRVGRWIAEDRGRFEVWEGRQCRLICAGEKGNEFGYAWDSSRPELYFYKSKSCKREGHCGAAGFFKLSEQRRESGRSFWNVDLLGEEGTKAALLRLVPAGAGYKGFLRQLPRTFQTMSCFP